MDEQENARARSEAIRPSSTLSSADRARFWAGLNRYLASELRRATWTPAHHRAPHHRSGHQHG